MEVGRLTGAIALDDVHFRYPTATGDEAVAGVSVRLDAGSTVALVGSTGAGKSTILKLIGRFYDPVSGAVRVDGRRPDGSSAAGVDLRDVGLSSFRRQLGFVPQEAFLFATTVRDNIAYAMFTAWGEYTYDETLGTERVLHHVPEGGVHSLEDARPYFTWGEIAIDARGALTLSARVSGNTSARELSAAALGASLA